MNEHERRQENIQQQKAKIRRRYQGMEPEKIRVIPVTVSQPDFYDDSEPGGWRSTPVSLQEIPAKLPPMSFSGTIMKNRCKSIPTGRWSRSMPTRA